MRRKPLFPPPNDSGTGKNKHNKGRQDYTVRTVNGRVRLWRRRLYSPGEGATAPLNRWLDKEFSINVNVLESYVTDLDMWRGPHSLRSQASAPPFNTT
jgi:hypothetical protein